MAKRGAIKVFAVVVLAGASTVDAQPLKQVTAVVKTSPTPAAVKHEPKPERVDWASYIDMEAALLSPLVLANGRPACGNTGGKSSYSMKRSCVTPEQEAQAESDLATELAKL